MSSGPHSVQFSARPFVAGVLTGIRAYRAEPDGVLTGIHFKQEVLPGENLAECPSHRERQQLEHAFAKFCGVPVEEDDGHELVGLACQCGFYGYFDGGSDYMRSGFEHTPRVEAIVEAYGKVVVGSRGFRAEKLRLVALIRADRKPDRARRLDRAAEFLGYRPLLAATLVALFLAVGLGVTVLAAAVSAWWFPIEVALFTAGALVHRLYLNGSRRLLERRIARMMGHKPAPTPEGWDAIKRRYPDVPVYTSRKAALAAHPLTVPDAS